MATAEQKKRQRLKAKKTGGRQISAEMRGEDIALLDRIQKKHPSMTMRELIVSGLKCLDGMNGVTWEDVRAEINALIDGKVK